MAVAWQGLDCGCDVLRKKVSFHCGVSFGLMGKKVIESRLGYRGVSLGCKQIGEVGMLYIKELTGVPRLTSSISNLPKCLYLHQLLDIPDHRQSRSRLT